MMRLTCSKPRNTPTQQKGTLPGNRVLVDTNRWRLHWIDAGSLCNPAIPAQRPLLPRPARLMRSVSHNANQTADAICSRIRSWRTRMSPKTRCPSQSTAAGTDAQDCSQDPTYGVKYLKPARFRKKFPLPATINPKQAFFPTMPPQ